MNTIKDECIRDAMSCNKHLTKEFLTQLPNLQLLSFVHPTYRNYYANKFGYEAQLFMNKYGKYTNNYIYKYIDKNIS